MWEAFGALLFAHFPLLRLKGKSRYLSNTQATQRVEDKCFHSEDTSVWGQLGHIGPVQGLSVLRGR